MLSFFPRDVLDEIWDLILSQFLKVFLSTLALKSFTEFVLMKVSGSKIARPIGSFV